MLSTGVDLIEVARVRRTAERHGERFYRRFFTAAEQAYCQQRFTSLAAHIAAKEAVAKTLGCGIGPVAWVEIEVQHDPQGRPQVVLHGNAARLAAEQGLRAWSISLSHTQEQAIAFVVAMGEP